jgi:hypothetical protein
MPSGLSGTVVPAAAGRTTWAVCRGHLEHALGLDFDDEDDRRRWRAAETELLTSALYPRGAPTEPSG